jgi:inner membrane protein
MEPSNQITAPGFYNRNRILIKGLLIGFLVLIMLIPAALINNLVQERASRKLQVVNEVSKKWANEQTVTGPVLMVPYLVTQGSGEKATSIKKWAYFLPDELHINGDVIPEKRSRSLYNVTLYQSALSITGKFNPLPVSSLQLDPQRMVWDEARLLLGVTDAIGLQEEVVLNWGGSKKNLEAGLPENAVLKNGLSTTVALNAQAGSEFSIRLNLRGSNSLNFVPVGKVTQVALQSKWPHPDFTGQYIPNETPAISDKGFNARWQILQSSRPYPQSWKDGTHDLRAAAFGVHLIQPADGYAMTERSVKYAILFISLTFAVFFFLELVQKRKVHPLQYLLVGFALTIFYTLLLSVSEHLGFNPAYLIAAAATVGLTGMYVWSIFQNGKTAIGFSLALGGLYSYIFILIQLEDYALLFGSIGLFVILAIIMYFSRKIDWYEVERYKPAVS